MLISVEKQREIIFRNFYKLKKARYWTEEQRGQIYLGELEKVFWKERNRSSRGFAFPCVPKGKDEMKYIWIFIRLFYDDEDLKLKRLIETIAHEFAHAWLYFKYEYPKNKEKKRCENNPEHDEKKREFKDYLMERLEEEEKKLIQRQGGTE